MRGKKSVRHRWMGLAALPFLWLLTLGQGCFVVEAACYEGEVICSGSYIEQCVDNTWVIIDDCFDLCGGTCVTLELEGPACLC